MLARSELGHGFNPVRFYYCFDGDERVERVVAEVTNTPWGEQHAYVLEPGRGHGRAKAFHVSPFLGMDHEYRFRVGEPGEKLLHPHRRCDGARSTRRSRSAAVRRRAPRLRPSPLATKARIYGQALRLKLKGAPYFAHPEEAPDDRALHRDRGCCAASRAAR